MGHQQGDVAPVGRVGLEQAQQACLGYVQQGAGAFCEGIVGTRLAVEQGDFAEPVWCLHQNQQRLLA